MKITIKVVEFWDDDIRFQFHMFKMLHLPRFSKFPNSLPVSLKEKERVLQNSFMMKHFTAVQWLPFENGQSPFYIVNEVTLTGQKPSLKFC